MNENKTENKPCRNCVHRPVDNRKPYGWECSECCHFYGSKFEKRAEGENENCGGGKTMAELFDKRYVHFMWEDELAGKEVITGEGINSLIAQVNRGCVSFDVVREFPDSEFPFYDIKSHRIYRFAYYDPNYSVKKAYAEGKQIQTRLNDSYEWKDVNTPEWIEEKEYRIKPELNYRCNSCKGKSFNCHNCKNKDAEGSYWTLFLENCIVPEEPKSRRMTETVDRLDWLSKHRY